MTNATTTGEEEFAATIRTLDTEERAALFVALRRSAKARTEAGHKRALNDFWRFCQRRRGIEATSTYV